mgnify:CR=1 FL=1
MNKLTSTVIGAVCLAAMGCSSEFWKGGATGTAAGVAGAGAGYELHARRQLQKLDEDLQAGRITPQEYEIREDQIQKGSVFY